MEADAPRDKSDLPHAALFAGLRTEDVERIIRSLTRLRFPAGAAILVQGDSPSGLFVILSGTARVSTHERDIEESVAEVGAGSTIGELSLLTGRSVSATVRARSDVEVAHFDARAWEAAAKLHPRLLGNLAAIVADRARTATSRNLLAEPLRPILVADLSAPPLLVDALAASIAWHTRASTLLIVVAETPEGGRGDVLSHFAAEPVCASSSSGFSRPTLVRPRRPGPAMHLLLLPSVDGWNAATAALAAPIAKRYERVLVTGAIFDDEARPQLVARRAESSQALGRLELSQTDDGLSPIGFDIPTLGRVDLDGLRRGALAPNTPAGLRIGTIARRLVGLRIGLALGAGSAKGYAHFGVLKVLEGTGIPIDCVTGTSIGASIAFLRATEHPLEAAIEAIDEVASRTIRLGRPGAGLLSSAGLRRGLEAFCGDRRIESCAVPLGIVAADLERRSEVVFRSGLVWPALLASMSIPGIYPALQIGDALLVDGGIVNPVPISTATRIGADVVIGVRLAGGPAAAPRDLEAMVPRAGRTSIARTVYRSFEMLEATVSTHGSRFASVLIDAVPGSVDSGGLRRFSEGRRHIAGGEAAAESALPRLRSLIPWLSNEQNGASWPTQSTSTT